jgi:GxxExxY protein
MTLINADPYSRRVIGCAIEVHRTLGPALLESVYEAAYAKNSPGRAWRSSGNKSPVVYKEHRLDCDLTMTLL